MSKTTWTPGPWLILTAKGYPYAIQASHVSPNTPGVIRDITRWAAISMPSSKEGQANARLIAAAPEMAEALEALASAFISHTQWSGEPPNEVVNARAILARINGEAGR
jgi:hypothetical protein